MDEDAIDAEALQAQIDLSMSFAQNLVSSWIQPYKISRGPHKNDLEKELLEYMRRPARLGVGASVPEGYNAAAREIARLKGKLAGTKHSREDDDAIAPQQLSDTEAESKAAAIKKRPKYDPFDVVHGKKKKKKEENIDPQPVATNSNVTQLQATISPKGTEACNQCLDEPKPTSPTLTPSKKKKKWKKLKVEEGVEDREAGPSSALLRNGSGNVVNHPSTPPRSAELLVNVSLTSTPPLNILQPRHKSTPFDLLKAPLLNLKPLSDDGPDHEGIPSSSPKKRKRRRRKKNMLMHSAADIDMGNMLPDLE